MITNHVCKIMTEEILKSYLKEWCNRRKIKIAKTEI